MERDLHLRTAYAGRWPPQIACGLRAAWTVLGHETFSIRPTPCKRMQATCMGVARYRWMTRPLKTAVMLKTGTQLRPGLRGPAGLKLCWPPKEATAPSQKMWEFIGSISINLPSCQHALWHAVSLHGDCENVQVQGLP